MQIAQKRNVYFNVPFSPSSSAMRSPSTLNVYEQGLVAYRLGFKPRLLVLETNRLTFVLSVYRKRVQPYCYEVFETTRLQVALLFQL